MYTSQDQQSGLAVLLGARSLDDFLSRVEAANSLSAQDTALIQQVVGFQRQIVHRQTLLRNERLRQRRLVSARAAERSQIEGRLASERQLYSSVRAQIQHMIASQQAQQVAAAQAARVAAQPRTANLKPNFVSPPTSVPGGRYGGVVGIAMQYLGTPYVWGGESPSGFDCSGLVAYVYAQVGVSLPHSTYAQWAYQPAASVSRSQLEPGDLVFFYGLGHVGIYVGGGNFIHAPHTGSTVRIDSLNGAGYSSAYVGAKRILG
jgi:cell wall-associated NlpC family hydrolase